MIDWQPSNRPELLPFKTEAAAVEFVDAFLKPYCATLRHEPTFANGLRPDIGFRLSVLPDRPLVVEIKRFEEGQISPLVAAIRQAHDYTKLTGNVAFVGPIQARGPTHLSWQHSVIGAIGLLAAQFSVGYLYCSPRGGGGLYIGGQAAVRFEEDGTATLHSNADVLLTRKEFSGSTTWRKVA